MDVFHELEQRNKKINFILNKLKIDYLDQYQ